MVACLGEHPLQNVPNWLSICKFLLPLRSFSFLKANLVKVLTRTFKKNVQTLNTALGTFIFPDLPHPPPPLFLLSASSQPPGRFPRVALCASFHCFFAHSCNILLLFLSLAKSYHLSKLNSVQMYHHYEDLPAPF